MRSNATPALNRGFFELLPQKGFYLFPFISIPKCAGALHFGQTSSEEVQSAFSLFHILLDLLSMIMVGKSVMPSMTGTVITKVSLES